MVPEVTYKPDYTTQPAQIKALATAVLRGLTDDFVVDSKGNGIFSVQSVSAKDGGIVLHDPYTVDAIGQTCNCVGFMHMGRCKHILAALRFEAGHSARPSVDANGLYVIKEGHQHRAIEDAGKTAIMVFLNEDDALAMNRNGTSVVTPFDANIQVGLYDGICIVIGKYLVPIWQHDE